VNLRKLALLAGILAALAIPGAAWATSTGDGWDHAQTVIPGDQCGHSGDKGVHQGKNGIEHYECQQNWNDECPIWHHVPQVGAGPRWTPKSCDCTSSPTPSSTGSPTPSASPSSTPTVTPPPSATTPTSPLPVHSTAVAAGDSGSLPVTGSPIIGLTALGGSSVAGGTLLLAALRRWRRRTPEVMS
jgi:hypothetical protein